MQSTTYSYYSKVTSDVNGGTYTDVMTHLGQIRQLTNVPFPEYFPPTQVYIPLSCDVTFFITRPTGDRKTLWSAWRSELSFNHVTLGWGIPPTAHWNEAVPVSFITMDLGGTTIEGAKKVTTGSPLAPGGPIGPGGPWAPWGPRFPLGPCVPGSPSLPGRPLWPGLPRFPLMLLGQWTIRARLLMANLTSFLMVSRSSISVSFFSTILAERLERVFNSTVKI